MTVAKRLRTGAFVALVFAVSIVTTGSVYAVSAESSVTNSTNTLKVSPVRSDVVIEPGSSKEVDILITNISDEEIKLDAKENDFVSGDENGTPSLLMNENDFSNRSLKRYIEPIGSVTIPANESVTVKAKISVPADAKAGGYFGAVRFVPSVLGSGSQVNMSPSVASLVLLTVPGDLVEKLTLKTYEVQQKGKSSAYFGSAENLKLFVRFANEGNVQVGPFGKVTVSKGNEVVYEADFNDNDPREVVLPEGARRWEVPLKDIDGFGKYTVSSTFTYGSTNQSIEATKTFWVIPVAFIVAVVAVLLVLIGAIIFATRKYLKSEKHQRSKASGSGRGR